MARIQNVYMIIPGCGIDGADIHASKEQALCLLEACRSNNPKQVCDLPGFKPGTYRGSMQFWRKHLQARDCFEVAMKAMDKRIVIIINKTKELNSEFFVDKQTPVSDLEKGG